MSEKDYDPNMHTVEHLLNGTISKMFGCGRAFSTHIERKKSKLDFYFNRNFTNEEIAAIEKEVNDIISSDVDVTEEFLLIEDARKIYDLTRLPEDVVGEIRVIRVGEYDSCPCIGSHVKGTCDIVGLLRIISTDFNEERGVLRVRFKVKVD